MPVSHVSAGAVTRASYSSNELDSFCLTAFLDEDTRYADDIDLTNVDSWTTYSPTLYWPKVFDSMHFFAHAGSLGNNVIDPDYLVDGSSYSLSFDYSLPAASADGNDAERQSDIVFAITPERTEGEVPLHFYHALSAVVFKVADFADAEISKSVVTIGEVCSSGSCSASYPLDTDSFIWTLSDGVKGDYTETVVRDIADDSLINLPAETFNMLPQSFAGKDAYFDISFTIGEKVYEFPSAKFDGLTQDWKPGRRYIYTLSKGGYVEVDVQDKCTATVKSDVKIQNTGLVTSYIRAAVIGYWVVIQDGIEVVSAVWDINDASVGTVVRSSEWSSCWEEKDGIFYCKTPVKPGECTPVPLFDRYDLVKTAGPVSGSKLYINIAAQAVEQSEMVSAWPDSPLI